MSLKAQYEFLFVGKDEGSFVENYAYDLGEGNEGGGKIFINLEIQNNPADAEAVGETIFDSLRRVFFADTEKDPYVRFEDAVREVNKSLTVFKEEKGTDYLGDLNVVISAIVGKQLFLTQTGEAEAYLIRKRLCSPISEGLQEEGAKEIFSNIASGTVELGDLVVFSSTRLLRYISKTDLAKLVSGGNLVASLGELKDFLSTEVLGKIGVIGVNFNEAVPQFTPSEKGQIVAHLEKEEVFDAKSKEKQGVADTLKGAVSRLSDAVDDLRRRVGSSRVKKGKKVTPAMKNKISELVSRNNWNKDKVFFTLIVVVIILTLSIWWLKSRVSEQQTIEAYAATLNEIREEIDSAETTGQYNKTQAGEILNHAEDQAIEILNSGYHRSKANEMLQEIQNMRDSLDGVLRPEAKVLVDLSEKRENVSALGLLGLNGTLYAYEYNALYPITLDQLGDPLTIDDNETVIAGAVYEDEGSLLFYTKSGKVLEYKDNRITFQDTADGAFRKGVAFEAYGNNIYILDTAENQIWRYKKRSVFDAPVAWNVNGEIQNAVDLAIDGSIYVALNDGTIVKMHSGNTEDFPIKKEPVKPLENPTKIYTELDMSQIYVLEPSNKRIMVYYKDDKGGAIYANQYVFENIDEMRDIYVDKDTNKLYILDKSKVYEMVL